MFGVPSVLENEEDAEPSHEAARGERQDVRVLGVRFQVEADAQYETPPDQEALDARQFQMRHMLEGVQVEQRSDEAQSAEAPDRAVLLRHLRKDVSEHVLPSEALVPGQEAEEVLRSYALERNQEPERGLCDSAEEGRVEPSV